MNNVCVLVCDAARARLFEIRGNDSTWHLLEAFSHSESRSKTTELVSDHSGQSSSQGASARHNALAPSTSPKEVEKGHFAHTLATWLDQAMRSQRLGRWVLVAPPHFLGMVKKELTSDLKKHLMTTVDQDLGRLAAKDLAAKLHDAVHIPVDERQVLRESDKHAH
jgi:protein required for attachment to host cells